MMLPENCSSILDFVLKHRKECPHHAPFWGTHELGIRRDGFGMKECPLIMGLGMYQRR